MWWSTGFLICHIIFDFVFGELILLSKEDENYYNFSCIPMGNEKDELVAWFDGNNFPLTNYRKTSLQDKIPFTSSNWKNGSTLDNNDNVPIQKSWRESELQTTENNKSVSFQSNKNGIKYFLISIFTQATAEVKLCQTTFSCRVLRLTNESDNSHNDMTKNIVNIVYFKWVHLYFKFGNKTLQVRDYYDINRQPVQYILEYEKITKVEVQSGLKSFWKYHKSMDYVYSNESVPNSPIANFHKKYDNGLLVIYTWMCNGCKLRIKLISEQDGTEYNNFNIANSTGKWNEQKLFVNNSIPKESNILIYVYTETISENIKNQFWKISDMEMFYNESVESISMEKNIMQKCNINCRLLNGKSQTEPNVTCSYKKLVSCCNLSLSRFYNSLWKIKKECGENNNCTCPLGYLENSDTKSDCDKKCDSDNWGLKFKENCNICEYNACDSNNTDNSCTKECIIDFSGNLCSSEILAKNITSNKAEIFPEKISNEYKTILNFLQSTSYQTTQKSQTILENHNSKIESSNSNKNKLCIIIAVVSTVLVFVFLLVVFCIYKCRRRKSGDIKILYSKNANRTTKTNPAEGLVIEMKNSKQKSRISSKPVHLDDFSRYLETCINNNCIELKNQHRMFEQGQQFTCNYGTSVENLSKNRYRNLTAYDHSRVVLRDFYDGDFINANYIDGYNCKNAYIATQGPMLETIPHFWHMIVQENVRYIVMITNMIEEGKEKCAQYWPDEHNYKIIIPNYSIENITTKTFGFYIIREFKIHNCGSNETTYVKQLHFTLWPDHGVPHYLRSFLPFLKIINAIPEKSYPILVHCSAGVGRTGALILCDIAIRMAKSERQVDFPKIVTKMREQRINLVQNEEQYIFAHLIIYEFFFGKDYSISIDNGFSKAIENATKREKLQEVLNYLMNSHDAVLQNISGNYTITDEDKMKNKDLSILPGIRRIQLPQYPFGNDGSEYINAVTVDCLNTKDKFIVTQQPMPNTLCDFWRMVDHCKVDKIISLNSIPQSDSTCDFFPALGQEIHPNNFLTIRTTECCDEVSYSIYKIIIENSTTRTKKCLTIFAVNDWESKDLIPNDPLVLLKIIEEVNSFSSGTYEAPIVVTCDDGSTASGLFVSLAFLIEIIKLEHICDVVSAIQSARVSRPQFVKYKAQVKFLYESALKYIQGFRTYANFQ